MVVLPMPKEQRFFHKMRIALRMINRVAPGATIVVAEKETPKSQQVTFGRKNQTGGNRIGQFYLSARKNHPTCLHFVYLVGLFVCPSTCPLFSFFSFALGIVMVT